MMLSELGCSLLQRSHRVSQRVSSISNSGGQNATQRRYISRATNFIRIPDIAGSYACDSVRTFGQCFIAI